MRLGLPNLGDVWVGVKALANELSVELVLPPPNSQRTLSLGVKYSPETACLPFKLTLGNMIEALELDADTLFIPGGAGPCRFGYYNKVQKQILRDLGYQFEMITQGRGLNYLLKRLTNQAPWWKIIRAYLFGISKLNALEELERAVHRVRAIEQRKGEASRIFRDAIEAIDFASSYAELRRIKRYHLFQLLNLPIIEKANPLKIGITGEFYVVLERFANMDIEVELGRLGIEVKRAIFTSELVSINPFIYIFGLREKDKAHRAATPYVCRHLGGDGWQSVGEKVLHANDWDGIVHLEPFGCLPEIMARNIMPSVKEGPPVLNIIYDEHTSKVGMVSRLEAFIDMLSRKRGVKSIYESVPRR